MNEYDRANLEFLLSASKETLEDWYSKTSDDDIEYALELLQAAKTEVDMHILNKLDWIEDVSEAEKVLKKFMG